ncbi:putative protease YhbU precursor [Vibrio alginolyticus]|uniref:Putative protease YhbU n=1 Tax=Vibrio alginolyticus TaxID=663 RepID=A0A1W6V4H0_VIBAL|nr:MULTISPECIES: peptidase U32 family protein [Vibrio]ARP00133.1 putative protease YhbU precursor [Vibrio alginolyticus]ARP04848.1 putative protease YhbU precursor [Vibrio alginolyticus]ARP09905.1 putative protease YhbU precursor [Vibrio alginolyticus]ARP14983.1 putative protease YhbU precursor [Vibrio alginolyticus]ARP20043.1 putative protease YhbU precursor [Vibrio alginolyticus]
MTRDQFELLAPGGDLDSIKAAIAAGADAIYCGLDRFNARNRATNLTLDNLNGVLTLAHQHRCKIFLTLNVLILESEIPAIVRLLSQLNTTKIDGVIVQDLGLAYILKHHFPDLDVHASTQLNTHNEGQILFLNQLTASRVNLSRELNISEIKHLAQFGREHNVMMEVFVHGSYCIGFSGICYISSARNGASGNRGRCSQPCREQYETTKTGNNYPLNMKDNSAFSDLEALADAGVYSLKVEGRIKKSHYVYTVVDNWRKQIDRLCEGLELSEDTTELYTVFNRDFSNAFLQGDFGKAMYIDNPRDHAVKHFSKVYQCQSADDVQAVKKKLYDDKTAIIEKVAEQTKSFDVTSTQVSGSSLKGSIDVPALPALPQPEPRQGAPKLSVLISSAQEAMLCEYHDVDVYYQLPMGLSGELSAMIELFQANPMLKPWFPAILIGEDYQSARVFLETIQPELLITNNSGVSMLAKELGLGWVAGPQLNTVNSYAFKCLQDEFAASGAFVSNELNIKQMRYIKRPKNMRSFYSIYHPNTLLTSRQCLFQQTEGCRKVKVNKGCLKRCDKRTSIINLKDNPYVVQKQKGSHNSIYSEHNVLNLQVLHDLPQLFTDVLIDLRDIQTETKVSASKPELIDAFLALLEDHSELAIQTLNDMIQPTANAQYLKGL